MVRTAMRWARAAASTSGPVAAPPTSTPAKRFSTERALASAPVAPVRIRVSCVGTSEVKAGSPRCSAWARAGSASATKASASKWPRRSGSGSGSAGESRPSTSAVRCARAITCTPAMCVGGSRGSQKPWPRVPVAVPSAAKRAAVASWEARSAARLRATAFAGPHGIRRWAPPAVSSKSEGRAAGAGKGPSHSRPVPVITSPIARTWVVSDAAEASYVGGISQGAVRAAEAPAPEGPEGPEGPEEEPGGRVIAVSPAGGGVAAG